MSPDCTQWSGWGLGTRLGGAELSVAAQNKFVTTHLLNVQFLGILKLKAYFCRGMLALNFNGYGT